MTLFIVPAQAWWHCCSLSRELLCALRELLCALRELLCALRERLCALRELCAHQDM